MEKLPSACFNVNPATLNKAAGHPDYFVSLYTKYGQELEALTRELAPWRANMLSAGYGADFGDMEAEMLYLLIRELAPDTVVEISPCHGYSTNYILAALGKNGRGQVTSFEISTETRGKPTAQVINDNLLPWIDRSRFTLKIGDATTDEVPACDFAFIDSCHEAWFAAWYIEKVVPKAGLCYIHDLVVDDRPIKSLMPKAATTGIRESYFLLHAMALKQQPLGAIADLELSIDPQARKSAIPRKASPERSIFFEGFTLDEKLKRVCAAQHSIIEARKQTFFGDRHGAIATMRKIAADNPDDNFTRLHAYQVIADLGYRAWALNDTFTDVRADLQTMKPFDDIATFAAALELGTKLGMTSFVRSTLKGASAVGTRATAYYAPIYWPYSFEFNRWVGAILRRLPVA